MELINREKIGEEVKDLSVFGYELVDLSGEIVEGEVVDISVFKRKELFKEFKYGSSEDKIARVIVEIRIKRNGEVVSTQIWEIINLPLGGIVNPRSKLGRWIKQYGKAPFIGQKVKVKFNAEGRGEVIL